MLTEQSVHYYGHGEVKMGPRTAGGNAQAFDISLPEVDSMDLTLSAEFIEHISKRGNIAIKDLHLAHQVTCTGKLTCAVHVKELLAAYLFGDVQTISGGSFAATAFDKTTAVVGDRLPLPGNKSKVSSLVLTDSTGSPVTLTLGTHYEADADAGWVSILSLSGLTQPLKAAGTEAAGSGVGLLKAQVADKWLRFKGINVANANGIVVVDLYRVQIAPVSSWTLLNDGNDVNKYEIDFEALADPTKNFSDTFGNFGKYRE